MLNLSSLTTNPILIEPKISPWLLRYLLVSHVLAIVPVAELVLTSNQKLLVCVFLLCSYWWQRYRIKCRRFGCCYLRGQWTVCQIKSGVGGPLESKNTPEKTDYKACLANQVVVTPWFVTLYFYFPGCRWRKTSILVTTDAVPSQTFRHLRVLLKMAPSIISPQ